MAPGERPLRRESGMTLIELLAAMAIFLGFAGMVLQVMGGGLDLWSSGERTRDENEQASALLDRLAGEVRHLVAADGGEGEPRRKLLVDAITYDADGDGMRDFRAQRLLFVRRLVEERVHLPLMAAGTHAEGAAPWRGAIDAQDARFSATEGLVEQALVPQPDMRRGYEGRLVLWRALQSPIGGPESFFALAQRDESGLSRAPLEPLAENVLLFSIGLIDDSVEDPSAPIGEQRGPMWMWDSTRGVLPAGDGFTGFRHAIGEASLRVADDDVFPTAIRFVVVVAPPPGEAPEAELAGDLPASGGVVRVDLRNGRYLRQLGAQAKLLKIGQEWVQCAESDGSSLMITQRGVLGTLPSVHAEGSRVLVGQRFERIVPLPCGRSDLAPRDLDRERRR
jgi:prepilin-type N-terminal cleavage/methylation domain-containing protein